MQIVSALESIGRLLNLPIRCKEIKKKKSIISAVAALVTSEERNRFHAYFCFFFFFFFLARFVQNRRMCNTLRLMLSTYTVLLETS